MFDVTSIKKMYFFGINIQDNEGKLHRLVCFQKAMEDFLSSKEKILLMNNVEQLVDYLLAMDKVRIRHAEEFDVIINIESI